MTIRVLMVVDRFPNEPFLAEQVGQLLQSGVDVHVLCQIEDRSSDAWAALGSIDMTGRIHPWPDRGRPLALARAAAGALTTAGRRLRSRFPARFAAALLAERRSGGPIRGQIGRLLFDLRVLAVDPDVVHVQFGDLARPRIHVAPATGVALTASFRGYDLAYAGLDDPDFYRTLWPALTAAHTLGDDLLALAKRRGAPGDLPWTIIPAATDATRFDPPDRTRQSLGPDDEIRVVSVGRLHWKKGLADGISAVAQLVADGRAVRYRIVGDGPDEEHLRWLIADLGLEEVVELVGRCDRTGVDQHLAWADLFLHPAHTEGFANAVLEAQAMALPVVCTDAEGLAENVADTETGFVVPRRRPDALAAALAELADQPERRVVMGTAGRERVASRFDLASQTEAFVRFFTNAADRARGRL